MADLDVEQIRAAHAAATPGPYRWAGNTDYGDVRLAAANGREVFALIARDRKPEDRATQGYRSHLRDIQIHDRSLSEGKGGYRDLTDEEIDDWTRTEWLEDEHEQPRTDNVLAFYAPGFAYEYARDLAVFEVGRHRGLPDDTPDTDERIYRRDVVDVRNPNARFLRDSWSYVDHLLGEVERLERERDEWVERADTWRRASEEQSREAARMRERDRAVTAWIAEAKTRGPLIAGAAYTLEGDLDAPAVADA